MDANLEEENKDSKVWLHGGMTAIDWLRIFRNLGKLTNVSAQYKGIFYGTCRGMSKNVNTFSFYNKVVCFIIVMN